MQLEVKIWPVQRRHRGLLKASKRAYRLRRILTVSAGEQNPFVTFIILSNSSVSDSDRRRVEVERDN